jgi:DNA-binding transcriptional ArsR family regulator
MKKKSSIGVVAGHAAAKKGVVPYGQLPNWIMALPISGDAKIVYIFLHSMAMKYNDNVFPEYVTISKETHVSVRSISRHLSVLEVVGAITRQQRRNKQRRTSNLYSVNVIPPEDLELRVGHLEGNWKPQEIESL